MKKLPKNEWQSSFLQMIDWVSKLAQLFTGWEVVDTLCLLTIPEMYYPVCRLAVIRSDTEKRNNRILLQLGKTSLPY